MQHMSARSLKTGTGAVVKLRVYWAVAQRRNYTLIWTQPTTASLLRHYSILNCSVKAIRDDKKTVNDGSHAPQQLLGQKAAQMWPLTEILMRHEWSLLFKTFNKCHALGFKWNPVPIMHFAFVTYSPDPVPNLETSCFDHHLLLQ